MEAADACGNSYNSATTVWMLVEAARAIARLPRYGSNCRRDPQLALRIGMAVADLPTSDAARAHELLADLCALGIGVLADETLAIEHRRRAWLIQPTATTPFASDAERAAYLVHPDTIAFLRARARAPNPPRLRLELAKALLAMGGSANRAEAIALLRDRHLWGDGEARLLLARLALEDGALIQAAAFLRPLARGGPIGAEPRLLLADIVRRQLAGAPDAYERWDAIESLAVLAYGGDTEAVAALFQEVAAANGGRRPESLKGPELAEVQDRLRPRLSDDDYPAAALRNEEQGWIVLRGLVDPRGRVIFTEPLEPNQSASLVNAVRRAYSYRTPPTVELGTARATPYMWVELPAVMFRISD